MTMLNLTREDVISRAMNHFTIRNGENLEVVYTALRALVDQDRLVENSIELRRLYFDTLQYCGYLGNYPVDILTEHDECVEHPLYTKKKWVALRRLNFTTVGYWDWVMEMIQLTG